MIHEVWLECHIDQGPQFVGGMKFGEAEAESFEEACIKVMRGEKDWDESNPTVYLGLCLVSSREEALSAVAEEHQKHFEAN